MVDSTWYSTVEYSTVQYSNVKLKKMSVWTLIANMGGLLGLCMGLSLVSLVEIAFYLGTFIMSSIMRIKSP